MGRGVLGCGLGAARRGRGGALGGGPEGWEQGVEKRSRISRKGGLRAALGGIAA
jgi:hypothetical protein